MRARCRILASPRSVGPETDWRLCTVLRCPVAPKTPDPDATIPSAQEARKIFGEFYAFVAGHDPSSTAADADDVQDALHQVATLQKVATTLQRRAERARAVRQGLSQRQPQGRTS